MDRVNLREQVVWATKPNPDLDNPNEDIQAMAEDYLRMGVVKARKMELPVPYIPEEEMSKTIMVRRRRVDRFDRGPGKRQGRL